MEYISGISLLVSALIAGQLLKLISDGRPRGRQI